MDVRINECRGLRRIAESIFHEVLGALRRFSFVDHQVGVGFRKAALFNQEFHRSSLAQRPVAHAINIRREVQAVVEQGQRMQSSSLVGGLFDLQVCQSLVKRPQRQVG